jgi:splicing factor U2AF subunit
MHVDQYGMPITRAVPVLAVIGAVSPPPVPTPVSSLPAGASAIDIANAALDAAMGKVASLATNHPTKILVLFNMVSHEDLATDDEYQGLLEEVGDECAKFGKLVGMKIPRVASASVQPSAIRKIFLEYATVHDAANAERELAGRQFGPNVVQVRFAKMHGGMHF